MKGQLLKVNFENYQFELCFKTQYCVSIKATDRIDSIIYCNDNAEFSKIHQPSIISALKDKNKQIQCKISERVVEDKGKKSQDGMKVTEKRCLLLEFKVSSQFIVSFSQQVMLYEIQTNKKPQNFFPKQINQKTGIEIRKSIDLIQKSIPQDNQQYKLQVHEFGKMSMVYKQNEQALVFYVFAAEIVALFILWMTYLSFLQALTVCGFSILVIVVYLSTQKYLLAKIHMKKGYYKVDLTGIISVQGGGAMQNRSVDLIAGFNFWNRQKIKVQFNSNYSYGYPISGTFLINSDESQELFIEIQKSRLYWFNLDNIIVTVQKLPLLSKVQ